MVLQAMGGRITYPTSFQRTWFLKEVVRILRINGMKGLEERTMKTFLNRQTNYVRKRPALQEQGSVIYASLVTENGTRLDLWAELIQLCLSMLSMFHIYVYISVHIVTLHCFWRAQRAPPSEKLQVIIFPRFQFKLFYHGILAYPSQKKGHS